MKKTLLFLISLCFALTMNAQTLMKVKQEGGYTNIRSGRGTNYRIVTKYRDGSNIYVGPNQGGWRAVYGSASGGFIGYISASKVVSYGSANRSVGSRGSLSYSFGYQLFGPDFMMARIKPEGGYTNLRNGNGRIIGKIKDGTPVYATWGDDGTYYSVYNSNGKYMGLVHHTKIVSY